jgi:hypothetical protein
MAKAGQEFKKGKKEEYTQDLWKETLEVKDFWFQ